mmetsp:Transcript_29022/g.58502  ORF Transcript_29022/g.58502 Transcript_29022/m.58502 type:complete len:208 (-) Transcript_29022:60-683(-)
MAIKQMSAKDRLAIFLYPPNLIGYARVWTLIISLREEDPWSSMSMWALMISLGLDYLDGPCARALNMCTQFGDLLDHYTDHITMFWLVYVTSNSTINIAVSALHCVVACVYMAVYGHYFKHSAGVNFVTQIVEENNYFNMPALLWNANTCIIPLIKMSFALEWGVPKKASTSLVDFVDMLGLLVTLAYSIAVCLPSTRDKATANEKQ